MIDVTISLISFNQRQDLERLLPSLVKAASRVNSEILLTDCSSIDGTVRFVRENYPTVNVYVNPQRAGYGENHNHNLRRSRGRYFLIMNSDMTVAEDVIVCLTNFMDQAPDVGIVSPKILNEDLTIQGLNKRYPTVCDLFLRRFMPRWLQRFCQRRLDYYEMRDVGYGHGYDVQFLSGAFMFARADLLKNLGGFDSRYFLYFEDVDLCRRVQLTHRTVYNPDTAVVHYWQREAHKSWRFTWYFMSSARRYFSQWGYRLF